MHKPPASYKNKFFYLWIFYFRRLVIISVNSDRFKVKGRDRESKINRLTFIRKIFNSEILIRSVIFLLFLIVLNLRAEVGRAHGILILEIRFIILSFARKVMFGNVTWKISQPNSNNYYWYRQCWCLQNKC